MLGAGSHRPWLSTKNCEGQSPNSPVPAKAHYGIYWNLTITEKAIEEAERYWPYFLDNTTYKSSTALSVSRDIWDKISNTGSADFTLYIEENEQLFCNGQLRTRDDGQLKLIFDDVVQPVPVIYAELEGIASEKGNGAKLGVCEASLTILDNKANPVILRMEARHIVAADDVFEGGEELFERLSLGIQGHIDPALPDLRADLGKADVGAIENRRAFHMGSADQPPAEIIGPGVIGADDALSAAMPVHQAHHAVPADTGEGSDRTGCIADAKDRLTGDRKGERVPGLGKLGGEPSEDPVPPENPFCLQCGDVVSPIEHWRQADRLLHRPCGGLAKLAHDIVK